MKQMILRFIPLILTASLFGAETNITYLPMESVVHVGRGAASRTYEEMMRGATNSECRPAELDPQGNWGQISAGLQLSVRLSTNRFVAGQPIDLTVILRNTTTNGLTLLGSGQATVKLTVSDEHDAPLWSTPPPIALSGPGSMLLPGRRQVKYHFDLRGPVTNTGTYNVSASRGLGQGKEGFAEVRSGTAFFHVVGAAKEP
jgi:hypothetical protein